MAIKEKHSSKDMEEKVEVKAYCFGKVISFQQ